MATLNEMMDIMEDNLLTRQEKECSYSPIGYCLSEPDSKCCPQNYHDCRHYISSKTEINT